MQYGDQEKINSSKATQRPLGAIHSPQDLDIGSAWQEITSPLDARVRDVFLRPLCLAAQYERSSYLMLPEALVIFRENCIRPANDDVAKAENEALVKTFLHREKLTAKDWIKFQSGDITLATYLRTLNKNSSFIFEQIREDNLMHRFASANLVRERLAEFDKIGQEILKEQKITPEKFLKLDSCASPSIQNLEAQIQMPLKILMKIKRDIDKIREIVEPMKTRFLQLNHRLVTSSVEIKQLKGLEFDDLVAVGKMGLLIALENFDFNRNLKFSTYAFPWINQGILREIKNNYHLGIAVPHNRQEDFIRIAKKIYVHLGDYDYRPTTEQLSKSTGMSEKNVIAALGIPREQYSLDETFVSCGQEIGSLHDTIPDNLYLEVFRNKEIRDVYELFNKKMQLLINPEHQRILAYRFNLEGQLKDEKTARDYFNSLGVSKERVRQVNITNLKALSSYAVISELSLKEILESVKDKISPVGLFLLTNLLSRESLPSADLIKTELVRKRFPSSPELYPSQRQHEEIVINKVLGLTRGIVINLANVIVWNSQPHDRGNLFQGKFPAEEEVLFIAYASQFYESHKAFSKTNRDLIKELKLDLDTLDLPKLLEKIDNSIMPELRSRYFKERDSF